MAKKNKLFVNFCVLLVSLAVGFAFLEILLRITYPMTLHDSIYDSNKHFYRFEQNKEYVMRSPQLFVNEYIFTFKRNSKGFSDYEHNYQNPKEKVRIVGIGDSFTEGGVAPQNSTFLSVLEKNLNLNFEKYEIINLGVGGTSIDNYYFTYKNEGALYNPKYVILGFFVGNDITPNFELLEINNSKIVKKTPSKETSWFLKLRKYLSTHSAFYKFSILLLNNNKAASDLLIDLGFFVPTKIDIYSASSRKMFLDGISSNLFMMDAINKLVQKNNSTLIILLIPPKEQVDNSKYEEYLQRNVSFGNGKFEAQKLINDFCSKKKIVCVDLLPDLITQNKNNTFYWQIDGHFNPAGHALASKILLKKIQELEN